MLIVEKCDRKVLIEGRSSGMGFAALKKVSDDEYHTVNPISPCKDYLNEVVFTENTGIPSKACGLIYSKKHGIFNEDYSYLVFKVQGLKNNDHRVTSEFTVEEYTEIIRNSIKNIENFINNLQDRIGIENKLSITEANDDHFLVKFDTIWARSTQSISLLTLLLRIAKNYKGGDIIKYLNNVITEFANDKAMSKTVVKKLDIIFENKRLPTMTESFINVLKENPNRSPHSKGIISWDGTY